MFFRKLGLPGTSVSGRSERPRGGTSSASVIGRHTRFRGEVRGRGGLEVRGMMEGSLRVDDHVAIAPEGRVSAEVAAVDLTVEGFLEGEIRIQDRLILSRSAKVHGHVESSRMEVEEGAILKGTVLRRLEGPGDEPGQSTP